MKPERPLILITNDDSVEAPGIRYLIDFVSDMADIVVVAPQHPHSGQSSALTVGSPLRIFERQGGENVRVFAVNGTPVDCIKLALHAIVPRTPDLVLSGINHGSNSGTAITYSGTMGAVLEACMVGIPAVGFSLCHHSMKADFTLAADYIRNITQDVLRNGLPDGLCLNVNIPAKVVPNGVRVCRAAKGYWSEEYVRYIDPYGTPFFMLTGQFVNSEPNCADTDEYWLQRNYVSVVPVTPDQSYVSAIKTFADRFDK